MAFKSLATKLIYVIRINDSRHANCFKVGEATYSGDEVDPQPNSRPLNQSARNRVNQYTQTAGIEYELLHTESTLCRQGGNLVVFNDKDVHNVLLRSGIKKKFLGTNCGEWFETDLQTIKNAIQAAKEGRTSLRADERSVDHSPVVLRDEQRDAVNQTTKRFKKHNRMLWNAKMRFGKTLSALQVVKEMDYTRTLILTHRPVVNEGWYEDFEKIFYDSPLYAYSSRQKGEDFANLEERAQQGLQKYIYFASMQDLRGSKDVGGKFDKNDAVFANPWDLLIIDEAHEGTQTELGANVIKALLKPETRLLELSGTPFNLLDSGAYDTEEIFTWDYVMEQRRKLEWDLSHPGEPNPYASLPRMNIFTFDLGEQLSRFRDEGGAFNFKEFFRTNDDGSFKYKREIYSFVTQLCTPDKENNYPFATKEYRDVFRHTLWMVPGVKAARALSAMLQDHPTFSAFKIVNVAGDGDADEENQEALKMVNEAMGNDPEETRTITLSCGRLTTGVTVRPWTAVLMMAGSYSTSASSYMQTIFRVQSPYTTKEGRVKEECYVFDFAPDRTLKVVAEATKARTKAGKTSEKDRAKIGEFLNFCPILGYKGGSMQRYATETLLTQLKKIAIERAVNTGFDSSDIYNDELLKLNGLDLEEFERLRGIVGKTAAQPRTKEIDVNAQGLTDEEYEQQEEEKKKKKGPKKELTPEEIERQKRLKEANKNRQSAISILRGISIRLPLLIYGCDLTDREEAEGLTIDEFVKKIDPLSWDEFMPSGVTKDLFRKFSKYYDPEVFVGSSKRIREKVRAADRQNVEERIARISALFSNFRNPDKETVLTPWRVVNMHLSDCLGGYDFFDAAHHETLEEPRFVDRGEVTAQVFNPETRILEINSKTGLYPLYAAYSTYRSRIARYAPQDLTDEIRQQLWDKTVAENIYVVCKTPMAQRITRRTLMGFRPGQCNTRHFEDLINKVQNQADLFVEKVSNPKNYNKNNPNAMIKFNAVIGNPPYQITDRGNGAQDAAAPIYHKFVSAAKTLNPNYVSIIMPAKWMVGGRSELSSFLQTMKTDEHIRKIVDYRNDREIFPTAHNDGGICYFLWDRAKKNKEIEYIHITLDGNIVRANTLNNPYISYVIRDSRSLGILKKILTPKDDESIVERFSSIISKTQPFGLRKDLFNSPQNYPTAKLSDVEYPGSIKVYGVKGKKGGAKRMVGYILPNIINDKYHALDKYKLFFTTTYSSDAKTPPETIKGLPNEICTETFLLIGPFQTKEQMTNCSDYIKTNFFRFLLFLGHGTMQVNKEVFSLIPLQDFRESLTDSVLYKKYELNSKEIEYIESMIKPMGNVPDADPEAAEADDVKKNS